jgi:hypothetical protein
MQRCVKDRQIKLSIREGETSEIGLHRYEVRVVVNVCSKAIQTAYAQVYCGDMMAAQRQAVSEPPVPCTQVDCVKGPRLTCLYGRQHAANKRAKGSPPHLPDLPIRIVRGCLRKSPIEICIGSAPLFRAADDFVLFQKWCVARRSLSR